MCFQLLRSNCLESPRRWSRFLLSLRRRISWSHSGVGVGVWGQSLVWNHSRQVFGATPMCLESLRFGVTLDPLGVTPEQVFVEYWSHSGAGSLCSSLSGASVWSHPRAGVGVWSQSGSGLELCWSHSGAGVGVWSHSGAVVWNHSRASVWSLSGASVCSHPGAGVGVWSHYGACVSSWCNCLESLQSRFLVSSGWISSHSRVGVGVWSHSGALSEHSRVFGVKEFVVIPELE